MIQRAAFVFTVVMALAVAACGNGNNGDGDASNIDSATDGTTDVDAAAVDAPTDGQIINSDGGPWECFQVTCQNHLLECGDCIDNDQDGEIDSHDPECLGPCDNTEGPGLEPGVGGVGGNTCQMDCFFDFGNGQGNDNCVWDHRCDPENPEGTVCPYEPQRIGGNDCPDTQVPQCANFCGPLTPNGCDCFGCCTFANAGPGGVGDRNIWIGALDQQNNSTCTLADVADPVKCPTCTPVAACYNDCAMCEVCIGHPPPPPECNPQQQCPSGEQPCGLPGQPSCPQGEYCITGCCQAAIP